VLKEAALRLTKRNLVESQARNDREVEITEVGRSIGTSAAAQPEVSSLTGDMIVSGEWEKVKLRSYNVSSAVPRTVPGKYHPYLRFLRIVKRKLVALGFREAVGPLVETAFINCDCLYMPQDHPAREIHDLYYLKDPSRASLEEYGGLVDRVAQTHENGWKTGSTGWRYEFSRDEASKLILRSHGTAVSVRTILSKDLQIPGKYFAIARCFRPDMLDKTHLTEFNQAEGIVLDPSLNLRNLLGILEMFAKEVAGADKVRFKPDYFPFTEPSIELQAYREGFGWMEFGGSGIFRPEVTEPLGVKAPVLAWGLGIDRLYMMSRKIHDIRQLFTSDLEWIRDQTVG
ncbi:MAG TPA: phenylalanine--tRNA ligase subunit alpha, partial [Candidatus Bathyarchaeia archaeon]